MWQEICHVRTTGLDKSIILIYTPHRVGRKAHAQVAQVVEHATENRSVGGSNPSLGTILFFPMM